MARKHIRVKSKKPFRIFLVAVLLVYFSVTFVKQQIKINALKADEMATNQKISLEKQKDKEMKEQMKEENLLSRVEDIARDKLGYLKEDEVLFIDSSVK